MGDQVNIIALIETEIPLPVKQCLESCDHGFRVEQTSDIEAFQRLISSKRFDCILSARESPSMGYIIGFQLTHYPHIPVVLFPQNELDALHGLENCERIAYNIRRRLTSRSKRISGRRNGNQGAATVVVRENEIYIRGADGRNVLWGYEGSGSHDVAKTMELELMAIDYVRDRLAEAVSDITEELCLSDVAPENVSDIVYEGYRKLLLWFRDLDVSLGHRRGR